jgi:uncharacterized protein (DUF433 family)
MGGVFPLTMRIAAARLDSVGRDVGSAYALNTVGAILGAPFMLSTLAMFVTGVAVLYVARNRPDRDVMPVDTTILAHDMRYFAIAYAIAAAEMGIAHIVTDYLNHGWSADEICIQYPDLRLAEVHSAMAYYFDHKPEIDAEIEEEQRAIQISRKTAPATLVEARLKAQGLLPRR